MNITVQKKVNPAYIFDGNVPNQPGKDHPYPICEINEDAEWIVEKEGKMPEGFCSWARRDLYKDLAVLRFGGNFESWGEPPYMYTACSAGYD